MVTELAGGVFRWLAALDHVVLRAADRPMARIDPDVLTVLRLGAYQLLHLDRVPPSAAVNESVRLVRQVGKSSAAGFVNAVLRRVAAARQAPGLPPLPAEAADREAALAYLSVTASHRDGSSSDGSIATGCRPWPTGPASTTPLPPWTLRANRFGSRATSWRGNWPTSACGPSRRGSRATASSCWAGTRTGPPSRAGACSSPRTRPASSSPSWSAPGPANVFWTPAPRRAARPAPSPGRWAGAACSSPAISGRRGSAAAPDPRGPGRRDRRHRPASTCAAASRSDRCSTGCSSTRPVPDWGFFGETRRFGGAAAPRSAALRSRAAVDGEPRRRGGPSRRASGLRDLLQRA